MRLETIITKKYMELKDTEITELNKLCNFCKNVNCLRENADVSCDFMMNDMDVDDAIHSLACMLKYSNDEYFDTALKLFIKYYGSSVRPYELYSVLREYDICGMCSGSGVNVSGDGIDSCEYCKGTGKIGRNHNDDDKIAGLIDSLIKIPHGCDEYYDLERLPYKYEKKNFFSNNLNKDIFVLYNNRTADVEYIGRYQDICRCIGYPFWCDIEDWSDGRYSLYKKEDFFKEYSITRKIESIEMYNLSQHLHIYSFNTLAGDLSDTDVLDNFVESFETNEEFRKYVINSLDNPLTKEEMNNDIISKVYMDFRVLGFEIKVESCKWVIETLHFMINGGQEGDLDETYRMLENVNTCAMYIFEYVRGIRLM